MVGTPNYPKSFSDAFTEIKQNLAATRTAANTRQAMSVVKAAAMTFLGDLIVDAGGRLIAKYSPEVAALVVGASKYEGGYSGIWMYRPEGQPVFTSYSNGKDSGFFAFWDKNAQILLSDDAVTGWGLAEPKLNYTVPQSTDALAWGHTTSTSFETIGRSYVTITHPRIQAIGQVTGAGTAVVGEFYIAVNGTQASPTWTGSFNDTFTVPGWGVSIKPGAFAFIEFKARLASGTGTVYGSVQGMRGVGS